MVQQELSTTASCGLGVGADEPCPGGEVPQESGERPEFRKVFLGYYTAVAAALSRLCVETQPPLLFLERIQKVKEELEAKKRLLESARREVATREVRILFLQRVLDQSCRVEFKPLIGYNTRIPALRPAHLNGGRVDLPGQVDPAGERP